MYIKSIVQFIVLIFLTLTLRGQMSTEAKVSIITCGPGIELYSGFGHTALRIYDSETRFDQVYNYGMFDFSDPDFYAKFARGKLRYWLGKAPMEMFVQSYKAENRKVTEQILNLEHQDVVQIYNYLEKNALPENKFYAYDFFFDNCATRPRDVLKKVLGERLKWHTHKDANQLSFRTIIDGFLVSGPWIDLGIDIVLGSVIDRKATNEELMFLPQYIYEIAEKSTIVNNGKEMALVNGASIVHYDPGSTAQSEAPFWQPAYFTWIIFAIVFALTFIRRYKPLWFLDIFLLLVTGLLGIFVLFMWFSTEHQATGANLNVLWLNPLNIVSIPILIFLSKKVWAGHYFKILAVFTGIVVVVSPMLPQTVHPALAPLTLAVALRYFTLSKWQRAK